MPAIYIASCPVCGHTHEVKDQKELDKKYNTWHQSMLNWLRHVHKEYMRALKKGFF